MIEQLNSIINLILFSKNIYDINIEYLSIIFGASLALVTPPD
jgi:hypothetical protein